MFGRRRRTAPVVFAPAVPAPAVLSPVAPALPELSSAQVFEHLHDALAELVGADGAWTLVPRQAGDTDTIFHGLKARQIATSLTAILAAETGRLRTEETVAPANIAEPGTDSPAVRVRIDAILVSSGAEPTALPWNPSPISVWAGQHESTGQPNGTRANSRTSARLVA